MFTFTNIINSVETNKNSARGINTATVLTVRTTKQVFSHTDTSMLQEGETLTSYKFFLEAGPGMVMVTAHGTISSPIESRRGIKVSYDICELDCCPENWWPEFHRFLKTK